MLLSWSTLSWSDGRLDVITVNTLVALLYSGPCSKHLLDIGVFVIQMPELNKSGSKRDQMI